jgi:hypothetical protein
MVDMDVSIESYASARKSSGEVFREFRHFSPEGFSENIWILFEGNEIGEELFDEICEKIFSHIFENEEEKSLSPIDRFEKGMAELNNKVSSESRLPESFLRQNSFVVLLSFENQIHFTTLGGAELYFLRGQKLMHISDGISAQSVDEDLFLNIASGEVQDGDVLFFSTVRLLRYVSNTQLKEIALHSPKESIDTLEDFIAKDEGGVFGILKASGAPALPFEKYEVHDHAKEEKPYAYASQQSGFSFHDVSLPPIFHGIKKYLPKQLKNEYLFLTIGLAFIFLLWSVITLLSTGVSGESEKYKLMLEEIKTDIGIAETEKNEGNKDEAIALLEVVELKATDVFNNSTYRIEAQRHLKRIEEMKDDISETTRISGDSLVNVSVKKSDVDLKGILSFEEEFYAYDSSSLFRIIGSQVDNVIPLKEGEEVIKGIPLEKKRIMVFLTKSGKILEGVGANIAFAKTEDPESWKKGVDIGFFDKNIYILSPENNEVYKYVKKTDEYSSPSAYNENADITDGLSMTIDGSIYVLKKGGEVIKMLRGESTPFELVDTPAGFEDVDQIYTLKDLDLMLFLDSEGKRIYIFNKGEKRAMFNRQILIDTDDDEISGMWFDINANRILVTGSQRVYEVALPR